MEKTSTPVQKRPLKREKPSCSVIDNILKYSASLSLILVAKCEPILVVNN